MKRNSCREASCRGDHLNQMAPVPKRIKEEEEGNKKAVTPAGTQHQLAIVKLCARTHLNKGFLAIHWTMEIHIIRKGERKRVIIIVTSSSLAQLHEDFKSLTGRPLEPSSCCFHATSGVELTVGCVQWGAHAAGDGWLLRAPTGLTTWVPVSWSSTVCEQFPAGWRGEGFLCETERLSGRLCHKGEEKSTRMWSRRACPLCRHLSYGCWICIESGKRPGSPRLLLFLLLPLLRQICRSSSSAFGQWGYSGRDKAGHYCQRRPQSLKRACVCVCVLLMQTA